MDELHGEQMQRIDEIEAPHLLGVSGFGQSAMKVIRWSMIDGEGLMVGS